MSECSSGRATSEAASPRFTAFGASLIARLPFALAFFLTAIVVSCVCVAEDDARSARVGEIGPGPVDEHDEPAAKSNQEINMEQQPEPPRHDAREAHLRQLRHRGMPADGGECAEVG